VDDDEATNLRNKKIIMNSGLVKRVSTVMSAMEGLELLRTRLRSGGTLPELILLDAYMPGMDGWQFAEEFRKLSQVHDITSKIVMLTGTPEEIEKMEANPVPQISGYKIKPLTEEMLLEIMKKYIQENFKEMI
jgi:CheY-like chemotaxis protein